MKPGNHIQVIHDHNVNIEKFPKQIIKKTGEFTEGALHGNTAKLLYILAKNNIATGQNIAKNYERMIDIYNMDATALTAKDINEFSNLLNEIEFRKESRLRLMGNELCDSGKNDIFTLLILEKLSKENVTVDILLSNHSAEFLESARKESFEASTLSNDFSMRNMSTLLKSRVIDASSIHKIINKHYKKSLKLIDYELNNDGSQLKIFTHALADLKAIKYAAIKLNIEYKASTVNELMNTIDSINESVNFYIRTDRLDQLGCNLTLDVSNIDVTKNPIEYLLWNYNWSTLTAQESIGNCTLIFVNGNDIPGLDLIGEDTNSEAYKHAQEKFIDINKNRIFLNNSLGQINRKDFWEIQETNSIGSHLFLHASEAELNPDYVKRKEEQHSLARKNQELRSIVNILTHENDLLNKSDKFLKSPSHKHFTQCAEENELLNQAYYEINRKTQIMEQNKNALSSEKQNFINLRDVLKNLNIQLATDLEHSKIHHQTLLDKSMDKVLDSQDVHLKNLQDETSQLLGEKSKLEEQLNQNESKYNLDKQSFFASEMSKASEIKQLQEEIKLFEKENNKELQANEIHCLATIEKLKLLTDEYLIHLAQEIKKSVNFKLEIDVNNCSNLIKQVRDNYAQLPPSKNLLVQKFETVSQLYEKLQNKNSSPAQALTNFYTFLNSNDIQQRIANHRDSKWQRYTLQAVALCGIILTGILPGLAVLGIMALKGKTPTLWDKGSLGAKYLDKLEAYDPNLVDSGTLKHSK